MRSSKIASSYLLLKANGRLHENGDLSETSGHYGRLAQASALHCVHLALARSLSDKAILSFSRSMGNLQSTLRTSQYQWQTDHFASHVFVPYRWHLFHLWSKQTSSGPDFQGPSGLLLQVADICLNSPLCTVPNTKSMTKPLIVLTSLAMSSWTSISVVPTCLPCSLRTRENGFQPTHTQYAHHSLLLHHAGIMPPNPGVLGWHLLLLPPTTSDQLRSVFHHGPITAYHGIKNTSGTEMAVAQHCRCQRNVPRCSTGPLQFSILRPSFEADPSRHRDFTGESCCEQLRPGTSKLQAFPVFPFWRCAVR